MRKSHVFPAFHTIIDNLAFPSPNPAIDRRDQISITMLAEAFLECFRDLYLVLHSQSAGFSHIFISLFPVVFKGIFGFIEE